jgi:hypothetical protein
MLRYVGTKLRYSFSIVIMSFIFSIIILFCLLFSYMISDAIKEVEYDLNSRLNYIESDLDERFLDTKSAFFNLANSLSKKFIYDNKQVRDELFSYFDDRSEYQLSVPFRPVIFVNNNMDIVHGKITQCGFSKNIPKIKFPEYFKEIRNKPFELYMGEIIYCSIIKKLVIPLVMSVIDNENQFIGIVWSGILIDRLDQQLSMRYAHSEYLGDIKLKNNKKHDIENSYTFNKAESVLSFSSILESFSQHRSVFVHKELKNHPFVIELEVKPEYFRSTLNLNILFWGVYIVIFIILFYCLYLFIKYRYKSPFLSIYQKLYFMNKSSKELYKTNDDIYSVDKFNPIKLAKYIDDLIEKYYLLQASTLAPSEIAIKQRILDLALTEKHFLSSSRSNIVAENKLYLNKLTKLIDEEYRIASLEKFLIQITNYCCEFYHEAKFKVIVSKKDQKNFSFKSSALSETIFNIITFVIRGNFNIYDETVLIKGIFNNKDSFPVITIEATISNEDSSTLGWNSGPSYVYSGLLSIYLLAKENNLFFNIKRKENKLLFILEPLNKKIQFYNQAFEGNELI